jgi:hypothetical protein
LNPRFLTLSFVSLVSCVSVPDRANHPQYTFPEKGVYLELPTGALENRPYKTLGWVRAKSDWPTLDQDSYSQTLCKNYFNKASASLFTEAKKVGADAVVQVRSVVFTLDGKAEEHSTPECSDDGAVGEVLVRGIAIKFKPLEEKPADRR